MGGVAFLWKIIVYAVGKSYRRGAWFAHCARPNAPTSGPVGLNKWEVASVRSTGSETVARAKEMDLLTCLQRYELDPTEPG